MVSTGLRRLMVTHGLDYVTVEMAYSAYGREVPERQYGKAK
jgi:hypothetical protein